MLSTTNALMLMTALFNAGLAIFIIRGDSKSPTNRLLTSYMATLSVWAFALIGTQFGSSYTFWLYCAKGTYAAGLIIAASFYLFTEVFPEDIRPARQTMLWAYGTVGVFIAVLLIFPTFLTERIVSHEWGNGAVLSVGPYLLFVLVFCFFYLGGLIRIWAKYFKAHGIVRTRLLVIALGVTATGIGGLYFDIILASPFVDQFQFIWTGPLFNTVLAVLITYSVLRLQLFNAKVIVTELLIALLWIFTLLRTLVATDGREQVLNGGLFIFSVIIGTLLVRSVRREVGQRELIEAQEKDLEQANRQQEGLLHFISHEIKGYLTKNQAVFASIVSGDFGATTPELAQFSKAALDDTRKGVATVMDILDASNLKTGKVSYDKKSFDLAAAVESVVTDLQPDAAAKGITLIYRKPVTGAFTIAGDEDKLRHHVLRNIIDNSIKYTPKGSVTIDLTRVDGKAKLVVSDTGVGITPEDMPRLFTEGGHGKDSIKVNVHSTGYGLFIAKQVVEAHSGTIKAESEGAGKGTRFTIELPLAA